MTQDIKHFCELNDNEQKTIFNKLKEEAKNNFSFIVYNPVFYDTFIDKECFDLTFDADISILDGCFSIYLNRQNRCEEDLFSINNDKGEFGFHNRDNSLVFENILIDEDVLIELFDEMFEIETNKEKLKEEYKRIALFMKKTHEELEKYENFTNINITEQYKYDKCLFNGKKSDIDFIKLHLFNC